MSIAEGVRLSFPGPHAVVAEPCSMEPPGSGQVLVRCSYSLISPGTELAMYTQTHIGFTDPCNNYAKYPFHPGYAAVGRVEAVGAGVEGLGVGMAVYYAGPHASYAVVEPSRSAVLPVPDDVPEVAAPFVRFGQITYAAVHVCVVPTRTVAVIGLGLIGNVAAQLFRLEGADIIGVDPLPFRRELAGRSGIDRLVDPGAEPTEEAVRTLTDGGADVVVEATGDPALVTTALEAARDGGEVVLLGSPRGLATIDVYRLVHRKGVTIRGAHETRITREGGAGPGTSQHDVSRRMLELVRQRRLKVEHLITGVVAPDDATDAYEALLREKNTTFGTLIDWSKSR